MATEGEKEKIARERVNIVYKNPLNEQEEVELPFKVLIMGDFSNTEDPTPLNERHPIPLNDSNLELVFKALSPSLDFRIKETLRGKSDETIAISLQLQSFADFEPNNLVEKIPSLKQVLKLRTSLLAARKCLGNIPELKNKLTELLKDPTQKAQLKQELSKFKFSINHNQDTENDFDDDSKDSSKKSKNLDPINFF
ncbi:MAG: type VI secretion system contractile sheath small subunit [Deltaproteobacteria bacterium]|jgi:type VI secretion system protein ImpB|nr:type VI secretion system contractile sheath small subunit [Deltaproteobacteria bacterium]